MPGTCFPVLLGGADVPDILLRQELGTTNELYL